MSNVNVNVKRLLSTSNYFVVTSEILISRPDTAYAKFANNNNKTEAALNSIKSSYGKESKLRNPKVAG
jgi:hypothetical protein